MNSWHKYDVAEVALEFGTDINNGKINVKSDRKRRGDNNIFLLPSVDSKSVFKKLAADASFALLMVVYVLAAIFGRFTESVCGMILLACIFSLVFWVKYASSKRIINSYKLLLPSAKVIENGKNIRLSVFDVEVGDLIEFSQGDIIPADARLVESSNLVVAERYYDPDTGKIAYRREEKSSEKIIDFDGGYDTYANIVYAASMVVSGKGRAIVIMTGEDTKLSGTGTAMNIVSSDDTPSYVTRFFNRAKAVSLLSFFAVIPLTFIILAFRNADPSTSSGFDFLYTFLLMLALAVTCMSEPVVLPADALLTKELLVSSRRGKAIKLNMSRITKLSSVDTIADTDTVLILNPNILADNEVSVRRIFFSGKQFRFDALGSNGLKTFCDSVYPVAKYASNSNSVETEALKKYFDKIAPDFSDVNVGKKPRILRNFPVQDAKSYVFDSDQNGSPLKYIVSSGDTVLLQRCSRMRGEGGQTVRLSQSEADKIQLEFEEYKALNMRAVVIFSSDSAKDKSLVFEGMLAIGSEYPFAGGELREEFNLSGIQPILYFDKENEYNVTFANNCGLVSSREDIVLASDYRRNGLSILDAPISTKVYIGFGREGVSALNNRLLSNSRKVLPVIKESADRRAVSPLRVYATHVTDSNDSVIISSSMSLRPADAANRRGGLLDALDLIRGCSMARLKLGVYKNYLAYSMFYRVAAVCGALMFGECGKYLSSVMILTLGFLCDSIALLAVMASKGIPVNPSDAVSDSKVMFSSSLFTFLSVAGLLSGAATYGISEFSPIWAGISVASTASMLTLSGIFSQIFALGGFLIILNKRSNKPAVNWFYLAALFVVCALSVFQSFAGERVFSLLQLLNVSRIPLSALPFSLACAALSIASVLLISRLLSITSNPKR